MPRANKPFQILKKINDNAYKVKLRGEYSINTTFNVSDLCLFVCLTYVMIRERILSRREGMV
jgi:hypothetical protein